MNKLNIRDDDGNEKAIDLDSLDLGTTTGESLTQEKSDALKKLLSNGSLDGLTPADKDELKDVVARIGAGKIPELAAAALVRFDLSWVSIK